MYFEARPSPRQHAMSMSHSADSLRESPTQVDMCEKKTIDVRDTGRTAVGRRHNANPHKKAGSQSYLQLE